MHRDLKPHNIVLTKQGVIRIIDFGTAGRIASDLSLISGGGELRRNASYLAPEQLEGGPGDARSDVYAMGLILWEAVAGVRPFAGDTVIAVALARLRHDVPRLSDHVDPRLSAAVECATQRTPAGRFDSAQEVADALTRVSGPRPVEITRRLIA